MSDSALSSWQVWALLSAVFAAHGDFCQVGVEDIDPDLATFIRTVIVPMSPAFLRYATGQFSHPDRSRREAGYILILSGSAPARRGSVTSAR